MTTDEDGVRREQNADADGGDGGPTEGEEKEGTGFVVSLLDDWEVTHTSDDVNAEVSYTTRFSGRERVTVAVRVGEPIEDDE